MQSTSPRYSLNKIDLWKITRGLLVVLAGTFLTYFASIMLQVNWVIPVGNGQFINVTPFLIPIFSSLIETSRRYLTSYSLPQE